MNIFITGGTGFIGTHLTDALIRSGHQVTILTRKVRGNHVYPDQCRFVQGDPTEKGLWQEEIKGHDAVINLAGSSIFKRWTGSAKRGIRESRILTTHNVVEAISGFGHPGMTLINGSAVGYYGFHEDEELDEESPPGSDFLANLAQEWESVAAGAQKTGVRVVITRFGVVLGRGGGALGMMVPLFAKGMGSPLGNGKQWFSWIHVADLVQIFLFILENKNITGPVNCTAPHPARNKAFTKALGAALNKPVFLPAVPGFAIRLVMGEFSDVLVRGQKVLPRKLRDAGFSFQFPEIEKALRNLVG